jgi:hypothetical protein
MVKQVLFQATDKLKLGMNLFLQQSNQEGTRNQEGSVGSNNKGGGSGSF